MLKERRDPAHLIEVFKMKAGIAAVAFENYFNDALSSEHAGTHTSW
jgi:hypothetical protein